MKEENYSLATLGELTLAANFFFQEINSAT